MAAADRWPRLAPAGWPCAREPDVRLGDDARDLRQRAPLDVERVPPGEQRVEHDAERVDVARGADLAAGQLLRARVVRRERLPARAGERRARVGVVLAQQRRDAEVHQLHRAVRRDQDVARLGVAVHDEAAVRVLHGGADGREELEALAERGAVAVAMDVERHAVDVLHDEVGEPLVGHAAVEQRADVRVVQPGEDLALAAEAAQHAVGRRAPADQLDGDALLELVVVADGLVDHAHPALPDLPQQPVGADAAARHAGGLARFGKPAHADDGRSLEALALALERLEQALDLAP